MVHRKPSGKQKIRTEDSSKSFVWFAQAKYDLEAAMSSTSNGFHEWACFQSEQSAEKALKSLIVHRGQRAPKIHKLSSLIGVVKRHVPELKGRYIQISTLQAFTFVSRYPFLVPGEREAPHNYITEKDANQCIEEASKVIELAKKLLNA